MIGLLCRNETCRYEAINLCKQFFPGHSVSQTESGDFQVEVSIPYQNEQEVATRVIVCSEKGCFEGNASAPRSEYLGAPDLDVAMGKAFYQAALPCTGYSPPWGILTGIRPVKLFKGLIGEVGLEETQRLFREEFYVSADKTQLCTQVALCELRELSPVEPQDCSLYISIPICPTRCAYCSFVSQENNKVGHKLIDEYLNLLCREIELTGEIIRSLGQRLKTVYIGGGTPAVLSPVQIKKLLASISPLAEGLEEYTFEAGRPDVIDREKLEVLKEYDVSRISINPQTLDDRVLESIGRRHTTAQFYQAFELASAMGFENINTDLIAGLPGDTTEGFCKTMDRILELKPSGITVHSFYKKRSSALAQTGQADEWITAKEAGGVSYAYDALRMNGYEPYYLYRQKDTVGGSENIGWGRNHQIGFYNIYMMNELHSVYACGAGGVTRLIRPDGKIQRIYNFKLPLEYIKGFSQMEERKRGVNEFYGG